MRISSIILAMTSFVFLAAHTASADPTEYNSQLKTRCDSGDAGACGVLGSRLRNGTDGTVKDQVAARVAYKRACEIGFLAACPNIANMQRKGYGGPKDEAGARQSLIHGCNGNDDDSCGVLGNMYRNGFGGPRDYTLAAEAYQKACDAGKAYLCETAEETRVKAAAAAPKKPSVQASQPAAPTDEYQALFEISMAGHPDTCERGVRNKTLDRLHLDSCEAGPKAVHEQFIKLLEKKDTIDTKQAGALSVATARAYLARAEFFKIAYDRTPNEELLNPLCIAATIGNSQLDPHPAYPVPASLNSEAARVKQRLKSIGEWCSKK